MRLGPYDFPSVDYDRFADMVRLRLEDGADGVSAGTTPEGHAFLYPDDGGDQVVGVDLEGVAGQLQDEGRVTITLPDGSVERLEQIERLVR